MYKFVDEEQIEMEMCRFMYSNVINGKLKCSDVKYFAHYLSSCCIEMVKN